jgi:hypothetical protein
MCRSVLHAMLAGCGSDRVQTAALDAECRARGLVPSKTNVEYDRCLAALDQAYNGPRRQASDAGWGASGHDGPGASCAARNSWRRPLLSTPLAAFFLIDDRQ